jgi:predicted transcriptional regulator
VIAVNSLLLPFGNDRFCVLNILKLHQIKVKDETYISLSQQEIADLAHFSKSKTNKILRFLMESHYIESYKNMRGKYKITDEGEIVLNAFLNLS